MSLYEIAMGTIILLLLNFHLKIPMKPNNSLDTANRKNQYVRLRKRSVCLVNTTYHYFAIMISPHNTCDANAECVLGEDETEKSVMNILLLGNASKKMFDSQRKLRLCHFLIEFCTRYQSSKKKGIIAHLLS